MKKFILLVSFMMAVIAQAVPSYWVALETSAYTGDESNGAKVESYAMYYCTIDAANTLFGGTSVSAIEKYIGSNFSKAKGLASTYDGVAFSDSEYQLVDYVNSSFNSSDYVAFVLYGDDAYRVYGAGSASLTSYGSIVFNETFAAQGSVGDWQQVPEPTSGLLLLVGLAGLALKRKTWR